MTVCLLPFDAGLVDHGIPFLDVIRETRHQLRRRTRLRDHADLGELALCTSGIASTSRIAWFIASTISFGVSFGAPTPFHDTTS